MWSDSASGKSTDGRFLAIVNWDNDERVWRFVWTDHQEIQTSTGKIQGLEGHAHPTILVSPDGARFVVVDSSAGHRHNDRILIYESSGQLVRSIGIDDVLLPFEFSDVFSSVSHIQWTGYDRANDRWFWLEKNGKSLCFLTEGGSKVTILLSNGRIVRQLIFVQLSRYVPWMWLVLGPMLLITRAGCRITHLTLPRSIVPLIDVLIVGAPLVGVLLRRISKMPSLLWRAPLLDSLLFAALGSLFCLLVLWGVTTKTRWPSRIPRFVLGASILLATLFAIWNRGYWAFVAHGMSLAIGLSILCVVSVVLWGRPVLQLAAKETEAKRPTDRAWQFSLRDISQWVVSAAILCTVARHAPFGDLSFESWPVVLVRGLLLSLVVLNAGFLVLGKARTVVRVTQFVATCLLCFAGDALTTRPASGQWSTAIVTFAALLLVFLLILRVHGLYMGFHRIPPSAMSKGD